MPFAWGDAAGAMVDERRAQRKEGMDLEHQLAQIAYQRALIEQSQAQEQRLREQMNMQREQFTVQQDERAADRRQQQNERGTRDLVGQFIRTNGITPENRHQIVGTLVEAGRMPSQQDLEDPSADVERARAIAEAQYGTAAKYRAPSAAASGSFTLGRGQVRYDDQGKEIARGDPFPAPATAGAGGGSNVGSLPAAIKDDLITMGTLFDMTNQAETLGNSIGWQGVGGMKSGSLAQFAAKNLGMGDKTGKEQELRNIIGNITATLARLRGGTSFTTNEQALLEQYTPTINDGDSVIQAKLRSLRQFVQTKRDNTLRVAGGDTRLGTSGPAIGERRMINGQQAEWDGKGWLPTGGR